MTSQSGPAENSPDTDEWAPDGVPPRMLRELSSAMSEQADRFEPSNDAYRKLAEAVGRESEPVWGRWLRPLAAAAAAVAVVSLGASLLTGRDAQQIGTGPGVEVAIDDTNPDEAASVDDGDVAESTEPESGDGDDAAAGTTGRNDESEAEEVESDADPAVDRLTGPVRSSELGAAEAFLDLLRLDYGVPELLDDRVLVRSVAGGDSADGSGPVMAELVLDDVGGGFAVVEATSELIVIDEIPQGDLQDGTLLVTGTGAGFEATLDVAVLSAFDNRILAGATARPDGLDPSSPFRAELAVAGAERGWVVVSGGGGVDGVLAPFAAKPISYRAGDNTTDYAVVRVPADDPDGGLNLRAGPGSTQELLTMIPAGERGVGRTGVQPVLVGDDAWWLVTTTGFDRGWVNSRYLASTEAVDDGELLELVQTLASGGASALPTPELPIGRRAEVAVGTITDPIEVAPESLLVGQGWSEPRPVTAPQPGGGTETVVESLVELLRLESWDPTSVEIGATFASPSDQRAAADYFGDLPRVAITASDPDGPDGSARRVFLFAEATPDGPEIVGLIVEFPS